MKRILTLFAFLMLSVFVLAQKSTDNAPMIKGYYNYTTLEKFFESLKTKYNIKIDYNPEDIKDIRFTYDFPGTNLEDAMKIALRDTKLSSFVDINHAVHIFNPVKKDAEKELADKTHFDGKAKKKGFTLTGVVKDKFSGETLPFANVIIKNSTIGATTNVDGNFSLLNVPTDTSTLIFSYIGYKTKYIFMTPETPIQNLLVEMTADGVLQEVVVTGEREELLHAGGEQIGMLKMSPAKMATLPNIGEKDIFRAFQLMPGVSAANEASSGLYVRGGTPDQSLVLYDGFTVYHVDHLFGFFSAFNANAVKDVQLYKGGFESRFGGRLSSVAELTGKDGNSKNLNVGADLSLLSANANVETPIGKNLTLLVAARRSYQGLLYDKIFKKYSGTTTTNTAREVNAGGRGNFSQFASTVSSYFYDLNAKLSWKPTDKDILSLSIYNGTDKMDNSRILNLPTALRNRGINFNSNITDVTNWGNTGASLKWSRQYSSQFYINNLISFSNYFSTRDRSNEGTTTNPTTGVVSSFRQGTLENNNLKDFSFKTSLEYKINDYNRIQGGIDATYNRIAYSYAQNDTSKIIDRNTNGSIIAGYFQDKIQLFKDKLTFVPGIRVTNFSGTGKNYVEPRFSSTLQVTNNFKLKFAYGDYYQFAKRVIREDVLQGSRDFWVLADDKLLPVSKATHYITGFTLENNRWLFDVEGYTKALTGLTEYSLRIRPNPRAVSFSENYFSGTGTARGIDFLLQKKYGKYNGWVGYSLAEAKYDIPAYNSGVYYAAQDVRHEFKTVHLYKLNNWDFAATFIFASGKPYTAPEGGYQVTLLDGTTKDFINVSDKNSRRLPDYHRLDLAVTYSWKSLEGAPRSIGVSVFNVYNHTNVWYKEYQIQAGQVIESNINYLGFTPNISISWHLR